MKISKINEVYLTLEVDDSLEKELSDYFTFEVPGAKFMPHYRKKLWDGKIRLFSPHNGRIYVGLLPYIKEFCLIFIAVWSPLTSSEAKLLSTWRPS